MCFCTVGYLSAATACKYRRKGHENVKNMGAYCLLRTGWAAGMQGAQLGDRLGDQLGQGRKGGGHALSGWGRRWRKGCRRLGCCWIQRQQRPRSRRWLVARMDIWDVTGRGLHAAQGLPHHPSLPHTQAVGRSSFRHPAREDPIHIADA